MPSASQYNDLTTELMFDTKATQDQVVDFYRQTLGKASWKATTDRTVEIDGKQVMIFRDSAQDLLTLEMCEVEGQTRVRVKHHSAAEIAELDRQLKDRAKAKTEAKAKPEPGN